MICYEKLVELSFFLNRNKYIMKWPPNCKKEVRYLALNYLVDTIKEEWNTFDISISDASLNHWYIVDLLELQENATFQVNITDSIEEEWSHLPERIGGARCREFVITHFNQLLQNETQLTPLASKICKYSYNNSKEAHKKSSNPSSPDHKVFLTESKLGKCVSCNSSVAQNIYEIQHSKTLLKEFHKLFGETKKETAENPFQPPEKVLNDVESFPEISVAPEIEKPPVIKVEEVKGDSNTRSFSPYPGMNVPGLKPNPPGAMEEPDLCAGSRSKRSARAKNLKEMTMEEVTKHRIPGDLWTVYNGVVYDISQWILVHPGGCVVLQRVAGKDCTAELKKQHPYINPAAILKDKQIGFIPDQFYAYNTFLFKPM